ncbi:MAG: chromate transporter [Pelistega sp.]|nr:chromate transporter [Pelistega sp.]
MIDSHSTSTTTDITPWAVFLIFLRLGLTSFGGPVAHLAYFRDEFVARRRWLSEQSYADMVALCQFLPGPSSSQVGIALGLSRSGFWGAVAAWCGFTLPSALLLILFALGVSHYSELIPTGFLHGLKVAAVAVVAQAIWGMARQLSAGTLRATITVIAASLILLFPSAWIQVTVIVLAAIFGTTFFKPKVIESHEVLRLPLTRRVGALCLSLFVILLIALPLCAGYFPNTSLAIIDAFYRAGSLVFGGGHVVLPLLQAEVVPNGWVNNDAFLAGYGAAQAVPGPLFTFAAFLGTSFTMAPNGFLGGMLALLAIFIPSFLLVIGTLPFWEQLRRYPRTQTALIGINAAVVGLLVAAFYDPVWTSAIHAPQDFALALVALLALMMWKLPPWLVVIGSGVLAWLLATVLG